MFVAYVVGQKNSRNKLEAAQVPPGLAWDRVKSSNPSGTSCFATDAALRFARFSYARFQ